MKETIVIETMFTEVPFEQRFAEIRKAGYRYAELWNLNGRDPRAVRRLADESGVEIIGLSGDISGRPGDPGMADADRRGDYIALVRECMDIAKVLGATYLHMHSNGSDEHGRTLVYDLSPQRQRDTMVQNLRALAPMLEQEGLICVMEPCNSLIDSPGYFLDHTAQGADIIREVASPHVRLIYDVYHAQVMEGNLINTIRSILDVMEYVHFSDCPGRHEPGTGEINFKNIVRTLQQVGFDGPLAYEVHPLTTTAAAVRAIRALYE